jgi:mRNA interferase MazF
MVKNYVPEKGDIVWLDFTPQLGHEQRKKTCYSIIKKNV